MNNFIWKKINFILLFIFWTDFLIWFIISCYKKYFKFQSDVPCSTNFFWTFYLKRYFVIDMSNNTKKYLSIGKIQTKNLWKKGPKNYIVIQYEFFALFEFWWLQCDTLTVFLVTFSWVKWTGKTNFAHQADRKKGPK